MSLLPPPPRWQVVTYLALLAGLIVLRWLV